MMGVGQVVAVAAVLTVFTEKAVVLLSWDLREAKKPGCRGNGGLKRLSLWANECHCMVERLLQCH